MQLEDLKKSISEMSTEELFALVKQIRSSRKQPAKKATAAKKVDKFSSLLKGLSKNEVDQLLKMIGGTNET